MILRSVVAAAILIFVSFSPLWSQSESEPYRDALTYRSGQPRTTLARVEVEIRSATPEELRAIEGRLLATLRSEASTRECRDWVCRQLRLAGSARSVPALVLLVRDRELDTVARLALQGLPGREVDEALRQVIPDLDGDLKAGVVLTLGSRGDPASVEVISPLVESPRRTVAEAALYALGHIGGDEALRVLKESSVPEELRGYRLQAMLLCAERMARGEELAGAAAAYEALYLVSRDPVSGDVRIRAAALRGMVLCRSPKSTESVLGALRSSDADIRMAAARFACELGDSELVAKVLAEIESLSPATQVLLLGMLDDRSALPSVTRLASSASPDVRVASLDALGRLGDAGSAGALLDAASSREGAEREAARRSLQTLGGGEVDSALTTAAASGPASRRVEALRALALRGGEGSLRVLLRAVGDPDGSVQAAALDALARVADARALPALVKLLIAGDTDDERRALVARAVLETCRQTADRKAAAAAFEAVAGVLESPQESVRNAARRVLAEWPDPAVLADLLRRAREASDPGIQTLCLRSIARLASLPGGPAVGEKVGVLAEALKLADHMEDRKALLAALAGVEDAGALGIAESLLAEESLEVEAASAVVRIAKFVRRTDPDRAAAAIQKILDTCRSATARELAESSAFVPPGMINIASQGTATSPDGLEKDGAASGDAAAIDGDPATYWDEEDGQKLYRLVVTFPRPRKVFVVSIMGYQHHGFAPKDFEILCDGVAVKKVENAQYDSNFLVVHLEGINLTTLELKITGYHGASPAIRELGIYRRVAGR